MRGFPELAVDFLSFKKHELPEQYWKDEEFPDVMNEAERRAEMRRIHTVMALDIGSTYANMQNAVDYQLKHETWIYDHVARNWFERFRYMPREERADLISEALLDWTEWASGLWRASSLPFKPPEVMFQKGETAAMRERFFGLLDVRRTIAGNAGPPTNCLLPKGWP